MAKLKLDIKGEEVAFFTDVWVFAIATFGLKDYRFCWLLNRALGLDLGRNSEFDIPYLEKKAKKIVQQDLFASAESEQLNNTLYFSFYQHEIPNTGTGIYLYNNHCLNNALIPEWKQADYFLYIPHDSGFSEEELVETFEHLKEVQWVRNINLNDPLFLKSRQNLMF